jgi:hypothetical protein
MTQRNKTIAFFAQLTKELREEVCLRAIAASRLAIEAESSDITVNTNKHDRVRLLHVFVDPNAASLWTDAYSPMERSVLDCASLQLRKSLKLLG